MAPASPCHVSQRVGGEGRVESCGERTVRFPEPPLRTRVPGRVVRRRSLVRLAGVRGSGSRMCHAVTSESCVLLVCGFQNPGADLCLLSLDTQRYTSPRPRYYHIDMTSLFWAACRAACFRKCLQSELGKCRLHLREPLSRTCGCSVRVSIHTAQSHGRFTVLARGAEATT